MWRCTTYWHLYTTHGTDRRPLGLRSTPATAIMSVSPPMPSPDQREATIPDRGMPASVAFLLVVLGPLIPVN
jgi:hypothetical protein